MGAMFSTNMHETKQYQPNKMREKFWRRVLSRILF